MSGSKTPLDDFMEEETRQKRRLAREIIVPEESARVCGVLGRGNLIITGTWEDALRRDFIIYTLYELTGPDAVTINGQPNETALFAYIARKGADHDDAKRSMYMTIKIFEKMARSRHFPTIITSGYTSKLVFGIESVQTHEHDPDWRHRPVIIVQHQHVALSSLPCFSPTATMPLPLVLRLCIGMINALAALHRAGFVHRQVSPYAFGVPYKLSIDAIFNDTMIIDVSLATPWPHKPRFDPKFVGSIRYVSYRVHTGAEHQPADDIISVIYVAAEMLEGRLPWSYLHPKEMKKIGEMKKKFYNHEAFNRLPHETRELYKKLWSHPACELDYDMILEAFITPIKRLEFEFPAWLKIANAFE